MRRSTRVTLRVVEQPEWANLRDQGRRLLGRNTRLGIIAVLLGVIIGTPSTARATVTTRDLERSDAIASPGLIDIFSYQDNSTWTISDNPGLATGLLDDQTALDLQTASGTAYDALTLKPIGSEGTSAPSQVTWWNLDWEQRQCITIDHSAQDAQTVEEYQIRVDIEVEALINQGYAQADYADLRAVTAGATATLPIWVDPVDDSVWVQVDKISAGETDVVCVYYDNAVGVQSAQANYGESSVFTYSTLKPIYYTVQAHYDETGGGPGSPLAVAAYTDDTQFQLDDGPVLTLDDGELLTVNGATSSSIISTTGPLSAAVDASEFDTIMPISWAATTFVIPSERTANQRLSFYSPFGDATVQVFDGTIVTPIDTISIPAQTAVWVEPPGDVINNNSIVVESDLPILVFHDQTNGRDSVPIIPFLDTEWYGVGSTSPHIGATKDGTHIDEYRSASATPNDWQVNRGEHKVLANGGRQGGSSNAAVRLVLDDSATPDPLVSPPDATFSAISQADGDGWESTSFFPANEMSNRYLIPASTEYISIACPTSGTRIYVQAPGTSASQIVCKGQETISWTIDRTRRNAVSSTVVNGETRPGAAVQVWSRSGEPFFVYYENVKTDDEANVIGMKQARQYTWPEPSLSQTKEGLFPKTGTWLSPDLNVAAGQRIFGQLELVATESPTTAVRVQLASANTANPSSFIGPAGTAATAFVPGNDQTITDYSHDGSAVARVKVTLSTTDRVTTPTFSGFTLTYDLQKLDRALGTQTSAIAAPVSAGETELSAAPVVRVRTTNTDADNTTLTLSATGVDGLDSYALRLQNLGAGIDSTLATSSGPLGSGQAFGTDISYSIVLDASLTTAGTPGNLSWLLNLEFSNSAALAQSDLTTQIPTP